MKRILVAILLLSPCLMGQSKDPSDEDGSTWQQSSQSFKIGYVDGYINAMDIAQLNTALMCALQLNLTAESEGGKACIAHAQAFNFEKITVGQFVDGVDAFYKDFRNTQFPLRGAMKIVRDQINGRAAEEIEKELVAWRQCHADSSKCVAPASPTKQATPK